MRFHAIPEAALVTLRQRPAALTVDDGGGNPLRCCLRRSEPGEKIMLVSYAPPGGKGGYAEVGPVFIHPEPCEGYRATGYPEAFRDGDRVFRAYDEKGWIVAAELAAGRDAEVALTRLFDKPEVVLVQARAVDYGCFTFAITR